MKRICKSCQHEFLSDGEHLDFLAKVAPAIRGRDLALPSSNLCPACRQRRRLAFHNERNLYRRNCDRSGASIISVYSAAKPVKVYQAKEWWSDSWSPYDFAQLSFAELQRSGDDFMALFGELSRAVPRLALRTINCENCEYNHNLVNSRDCYLTFGSAGCENCFYCAASINLKDCVNVWWCNAIELGGELFCCDELYDCWFCDRCANSRGLMYCRDCAHCSNCFGCANLSHAQYRIFNVQYSADEYEACLKSLNRSSYASLLKIAEQAREFHLSLPYRAITGEGFEKCSGDLIYRSSNCQECFTVAASEDCRWVYESARNKECRDLDFCYDCNGLVYDSINSFYCYASAFLLDCNQCSSSFYLMDCKGCKNCFGCIGLGDAEYCILNKAYTKNEYFELLPKIIGSLSARGQWGEFFPPEISPFFYNETKASEYYPLTPEQARLSGFNWGEELKTAAHIARVIKPADLPNSTEDAALDLVNCAIECEVTGKLFRIDLQELEFYRRVRLPLPRRHPDQRYRDMLAKVNPRKLWRRPCSQCKAELLTSFTPERSEIIVCEGCYQSLVF